jgi:nucleotide-binding universal stress UspA family protein
MYKRILVAVDGSRTSMMGLKEALRLARACAAKVCLVHVVDESLALRDSAFSFGTEDMLGTLRAGGEKVLQTAQAAAARQGLGAVAVLVESCKGRVAEAVAAEAVKWRADLLVLGTHGRRGLSHWVLGSDAELVARLAPAPVLLVRDTATRRRARR